ncbi:unnamed protein product [Didymodactylos carnosus]|uniref:Saposin B-type domain-containing protein n=1 Tax=Didymodactylos carnosus TaxID=1234261 RepID=A0A813UTV9_9BILA|nr:unnamed protein product [Didymodactylos carnosus]CAF0857255.1 unnamed protein product [Didymodactylos carnosus]CAF3621993.1 unnamed protein product [Didymodactylos carnosus]CAF3642220.1 unnamed protein product [Didymodactylos carnosus]
MLCNALVRLSNELYNQNGKHDQLEIKQFMKQDCTKLTGNDIQEKCVQAVDLYSADIYRHIVAKTELSKICAYIQGHDSLSSSSAIVIPSVAADNTTCVMCEFVIHILQEFLSENSSESEVEKWLEYVCQLMPTTIRSECRLFVDSYGPAIISVLVRDFDPPSVCKKIKLCSSSDKILTLKENHSSHIERKFPLMPADKDLDCVICRYVLTYIDTVLQQNKSAEAVEKALELVCTILSGKMKEQCDTFVKSYGLILVELLAELDDPNVVCQWLNLCKNNSNSPSVVVPPSSLSASDLECSICKYVLNYLDNVLKDNKSEAAIVDALDKVCTILPDKEKKQCIILVNAYGPLLEQLLAEFIDPTIVCEKLKLCTKIDDDQYHLVPVKQQ